VTLPATLSRRPLPSAVADALLTAAMVVLVVGLTSDLLGPIVVAAWHGRPDPFLLDFDALMIAGKAALRGELARAYSLDWMRSAQAALGLPAGMWLPFTYPPTAAILFAPLSALPPTVGYLCFAGVSLVTFLTGVAALGARGTRAVLLLSTVPVAYFNLRMGQNGLLTAGLAAHGARLWLSDRPGRAGFIAGLATFKPHLALGLPLAMLWAREARGVAAFFATAFGLIVLSVAAFGPSPWSA